MRIVRTVDETGDRLLSIEFEPSDDLKIVRKAFAIAEKTFRDRHDAPTCLIGDRRTKADEVNRILEGDLAKGVLERSKDRPFSIIFRPMILSHLMIVEYIGADPSFRHLNHRER